MSYSVHSGFRVRRHPGPALMAATNRFRGARRARCPGKPLVPFTAGSEAGGGLSWRNMAQIVAFGAGRSLSIASSLPPNCGHLASPKARSAPNAKPISSPRGSHESGTPSGCRTSPAPLSVGPRPKKPPATSRYHLQPFNCLIQHVQTPARAVPSRLTSPMRRRCAPMWEPARAGRRPRGRLPAWKPGLGHCSTARRPPGKVRPRPVRSPRRSRAGPPSHQQTG